MHYAATPWSRASWRSQQTVLLVRQTSCRCSIQKSIYSCSWIGSAPNQVVCETVKSLISFFLYVCQVYLSTANSQCSSRLAYPQAILQYYSHLDMEIVNVYYYGMHACIEINVQVRQPATSPQYSTVQCKPAVSGWPENINIIHFSHQYFC